MDTKALLRLFLMVTFTLGSADWVRADSAPHGGSVPVVAASARPAVETGASAPPGMAWLQSVDSAAALKLLLIVSVVLLGVGVVWKQWQFDPLVIEPLEIPKDLADQGLSGSVLAQWLADHIAHAQRSARPDDDTAEFAFVELARQQVDLQLPGVAWTFGGALRFVRQALGRPQRRLTGEVVQEHQAYYLRLRIGQSLPSNTQSRFYSTADIEAALTEAADLAIGLSDTFEAASIQYSRDDPSSGYAQTVALIRRHLATAPTRTHQDAYVLWASVHRALGDMRAVDAMLGRARACNAQVWRGQFEGPYGIRYCNFVGNLLRERREFEDAERHFRWALAADRDNVAALSNLGNMLHELWRLEDAEACFRRVIRKHPQSHRGWRGLGLVAMRRYDLDSALRYFDRASDVSPGPRWPRMNRIETLRRAGRYEDALDEIVALRRTQPRFSPLLRAWGDVLRDTGDLDGALGKFREAAAHEPAEPHVYQGEASVWRKLGRPAETIRAAVRALELRPSMMWATQHLAWALRHTGQHDRSFQLLEEAVRLAPEEPGMHVAMAGELRRRGRWDEARRVLDNVPPHAATNPEILREQGWLKADEGRLPEAMRYFELARSISPHDMWAAFSRVEVLRRMAQHDEALSLARQMTEQLPHDSEAWRRRSQCEWDAGERPASWVSLNRAIDSPVRDLWPRLIRTDMLQSIGDRQGAQTLLDSDDIRGSLIGRYQSELRLARLQRHMGDLDRALKHYDTAQRDDPHDLQALRGRAETLRLLGRASEAADQARRALAVAPRVGWPLLVLSDIAGDEFDFQTAAAHLDRARTQAPWDPEPLVALSRLFSNRGCLADAEAAASQAYCLQPWNVGAGLRLADSLLANERLVDSEVRARCVIAQWPSEARGWVTLGHVFVRQERLGAAQHAFRQALSLEPLRTDAIRGLADVHETLGQKGAGLALLRQAVVKDRLNLSLRIREAEFLSSLTLLQQADREVNPRLATDKAWGLRAAGYIARRTAATPQQGKKDAVAYFEQAVAVAPKDFRAQLALAEGRRDLNEVEAAIEAANEALRLHPGLADARRSLAITFRRASEDAQARIELDNGLRDNPRDLWLLDESASLHLARQEWDAAVSIGQQAVDLRPRRPQSLRRLAAAMYCVGRRADADALVECANTIELWRHED